MLLTLDVGDRPSPMMTRTLNWTTGACLDVGEIGAETRPHVTVPVGSHSCLRKNCHNEGTVCRWFLGSETSTNFGGQQFWTMSFSDSPWKTSRTCPDCPPKKIHHLKWSNDWIWQQFHGPPIDVQLSLRNSRDQRHCESCREDPPKNNCVCVYVYTYTILWIIINLMSRNNQVQSECVPTCGDQSGANMHNQCICFGSAIERQKKDTVCETLL